MIKKLNEGVPDNTHAVEEFSTLSNNCSELLSVLKQLTKRVTDIKNGADKIQDYIITEDLDEEDIEYFDDIVTHLITSTEHSYDNILSTNRALFNTWEIIGRIINDCDL